MDMCQFLAIVVLFQAAHGQGFPRLITSPQTITVSRPQILAVAAPQPVRTVIARQFTVTRNQQPQRPAQSQPPPQRPAPIQSQPRTVVRLDSPIQRLAVLQPTTEFRTAAPSTTTAQPLPTAPARSLPLEAASPAQSVPFDDEEDQTNQVAHQPYSFSYTAKNDDGSFHTREETSKDGVVTGSYSYLGKDGLTRVVRYIADDQGYRANVSTNEPGMAKGDPDPANVNIEILDSSNREEVIEEDEEVNNEEDESSRKDTNTVIEEDPTTAKPYPVYTPKPAYTTNSNGPDYGAGASEDTPQVSQVPSETKSAAQSRPSGTKSLLTAALTAPSRPSPAQASRSESRSAAQTRTPSLQSGTRLLTSSSETQTFRLIPVNGLLGGIGTEQAGTASVIFLHSMI
ncbi:Cuticle protein 16.8 [Halotydeus destructor]|nr:Cuticle protein 16.8 [Halotydeus destructor]